MATSHFWIHNYKNKSCFKSWAGSNDSNYITYGVLKGLLFSDSSLYDIMIIEMKGCVTSARIVALIKNIHSGLTWSKGRRF